MDLVRSTDQLPLGRSDFARGGCYAKAWQAIPGVYSLKRKLAEAVRAARSSSSTTNTGKAVIKPACVSGSGAALNSPEDFDAALGRAEDISQALEAGCDKQAMQVAGRARIASENQIFADNRTTLEAHQETYRNAMQTIERDRAFLGYLAVVVNGLKREMNSAEHQAHQHD